MTIELTTEERKTRELFESVSNIPINIMIKSVFVSQYHAALPINRIDAIACAIHHSTDLRIADLQKALTKLVRDKVLRSRMDHGRRFYEVNY